MRWSQIASNSSMSWPVACADSKPSFNSRLKTKNRRWKADMRSASDEARRTWYGPCRASSKRPDVVSRGLADRKNGEEDAEGCMQVALITSSQPLTPLPHPRTSAGQVDDPATDAAH